jgi:hypothetical protein
MVKLERKKFLFSWIPFNCKGSEVILSATQLLNLAKVRPTTQAPQFCSMNITHCWELFCRTEIFFRNGPQMVLSGLPNMSSTSNSESLTLILKVRCLLQLLQHFCNNLALFLWKKALFHGYILRVSHLCVKSPFFSDSIGVFHGNK